MNGFNFRRWATVAWIQASLLWFAGQFELDISINQAVVFTFIFWCETYLCFVGAAPVFFWESLLWPWTWKRFSRASSSSLLTNDLKNLLIVTQRSPNEFYGLKKKPLDNLISFGFWWFLFHFVAFFSVEDKKQMTKDRSIPLAVRDLSQVNLCTARPRYSGWRLGFKDSMLWLFSLYRKYISSSTFAGHLFLSQTHLPKYEPSPNSLRIIFYVWNMERHPSLFQWIGCQTMTKKYPAQHDYTMLYCFARGTLVACLTLGRDHAGTAGGELHRHWHDRMMLMFFQLFVYLFRYDDVNAMASFLNPGTKHERWVYRTWGFCCD